MRSISACLVVTVLTVGALAAACSKDPPPPATPIVNSQPTAAPMNGPQPPPTAVAPAPGQLATPGPTALACQNDSQCMTHRCNTQYGKCAFPCVSDADCIQGSACFVAGGPAAACLPKPPGAP